MESACLGPLANLCGVELLNFSCGKSISWDVPMFDADGGSSALDKVLNTFCVEFEKESTNVVLEHSGSLFILSFTTVTVVLSFDSCRFNLLMSEFINVKLPVVSITLVFVIMVESTSSQ